MIERITAALTLGHLSAVSALETIPELKLFCVTRGAILEGKIASPN